MAFNWPGYVQDGATSHKPAKMCVSEVHMDVIFLRQHYAYQPACIPTLPYCTVGYTVWQL